MTELKPKANPPIEQLPDVRKSLAEVGSAYGEVAKTLNDAVAGLNARIRLPHTFEGIRMGLPSIPKPPTKPSNVATIKRPNQLGDLIKLSRKSKNLTQQQLADLSGVGRRFIIECEAGKPRLEFAKVLQVAAAAGIDVFAIKR
jgi:y4mF family transcriptional regulator